MSNKTNNPDELSLKPGRNAAAGGGKQADFSNVKSSADTVPDAGNGGRKTDFSQVKSSASTVPADVTPSATTQSYTVQSGDTLSHIAQRYYGQAGQWNRIFEANRDQLDDPDLIQPGQVLKIPDTELDGK